MTEKPLTWFAFLGLVLLFISTCWMIVNLTIFSWQLEPEHIRTIMLTTSALANVSFLLSILASILGLGGVTGEEMARKATVYAFVAGILLQIASILLVSWSYTSPWRSIGLSV